jgi:hypothetical protein
MNGYDLILVDGGTKYHLKETLKSLTLEDDLNEIAYRAYASIIYLPDITIYEGQEAAIIGPQDEELLKPGVIWGIERNNAKTQDLSITIYDRSIYLKSEDEYVFPEGQTATQRLQQYAKDWNIPLGEIPDTKIPLAKSVYRAQSIYSMIFSDLKETAKKGGTMYRPKITDKGLELITLGSNSTVWAFKTGQNIEDYAEISSLDTVVTQVKVLGSALDNERSPVLAILKGDTGKYGTLQRVLMDEKITTVGEAKTKGQKALRDLQKSYLINTIDIPPIRAGDKIKLDDVDLIVITVTHNCGTPGRISMRAANIDYIRQEYYIDI